MIVDLLLVLVSIEMILIGFDVSFAYKIFGGSAQRKREKFQKGIYPFIFLVIGFAWIALIARQYFF